MLDNFDDDNPPYSRKISRYVSARVPTPADKRYIKYFYPIRVRPKGKKSRKISIYNITNRSVFP